MGNGSGQSHFCVYNNLKCPMLEDTLEYRRFVILGGTPCSPIETLDPDFRMCVANTAATGVRVCGQTGLSAEGDAEL